MVRIENIFFPRLRIQDDGLILCVKVLKMQKTRYLSEINYLGIFVSLIMNPKSELNTFSSPRWRIQDGGSHIMGKSTKNAKIETFT